MRSRFLSTLASLATLSAAPAFGQFLTLPAQPDNPKSTVTQQVGPVTVTIEYSSPRVVRGTDDRRGKVWGKLVPYGLTDLGFLNCTKCPWRAGANENTVFTVSQDVKVQGQPLRAGRYGLHMIPGQEEWTLIFSKNSTSWGSFTYDPKEDALRVPTKSAKSEYHEWLTYEFTEREPTKATVALKWEELQVPFSISVENASALYLATVRDELRGPKGFMWQSWKAAADYCLNSNTNLPEALDWAQKAVSMQFIGDENFQTLSTLSRAQAASGREEDAKKTLDKAIHHPTAKPVDLHQAGRQLLTAGKKDEALHIFKANAERFPNQWPVHVGLMRGYAAVGENQKALAEARLAMAQAPDPLNKKNLERLIKLLEEGKKID